MSRVTSSIADNTNVPCVSLHLSSPTRPSIHLHPHLNAKSLAVAAFIKREKWKDVVVVFEEADELLEVTDMITAGHFDPDSFSSQLVRLKHEDDYGNELKHIKNKLDRYRIVINIPLPRAIHFLEQAANMSMCGVLYHYVVMDMDLVTVDIDSMRGIEDCNITSFGVHDVHSEQIEDVRQEIVHKSSIRLPKKGVPYTTSIWIDTLRLLIRSMKSIHIWEEPRCGDVWKAGSDIKKKFFETPLNGISGDLYWAPSGERSNYTLHVYRRKLTFQKFAEWSSRTRRIASSEAVVIANSSEKLTLEGKHLKISVYLEAPFVMMTSNGSYEGYCIDLLHGICIHQENNLVLQLLKELRCNPSAISDLEPIDIKDLLIVSDQSTFLIETIEVTIEIWVNSQKIDISRKKTHEILVVLKHRIDEIVRIPFRVIKIANILKFTYTIQKVRDNAYGSKESNGKWSGMVGELQRGDADLAVASLTISYGRSEVIDFTKPRITDSDWFKFMDPLSTQVWIMTFASYFVVSIAIWIIAKISPYEQFERDEDNGQYKPVDNQFSLRNSFWFTVCSLMQQGSELCPRAASTRLLTGIWWFFALILISSYTANLAAVLTTRRMETPIENADDLAAQTKIKYGTLGRGSTMSFFNESKIETYERMWQLMSSSPGLFVQSSKEGIARVKSSDYAYLMESSMLEYAVERDCELMQIGGLIDQKGYGIGLPKGSPYRELISTAILRLQEKTELTELKEKWWKDKSVVCEQPKRKDQDDGESIGGIFIILVVGLVLTAVLVIFELITTRKPSPAQSQVIRHVNVIPTFKFEFFRLSTILGTFFRSRISCVPNTNGEFERSGTNFPDPGTVCSLPFAQTMRPLKT
ncbi:hypothetical protein GCK72_000189 [Caenorhabditis remanei]|uniref:Uncharacterized protein n=1 Tax=Caenorhabditis remanei TaxID=31234 RepID=A0A6A5HPZ3_CAERE|nr:hypothetical protein GCK72_000189 [Caenorhabditis remanei]KAF1768377.1 hypothetical protein GCK72_000189 [Caenorhabditis remanei]